MHGAVSVIAKRLADYRSIIGEARIEQIRALAAPLRGARLLHVNATAFGSGVAELTAALVPLMNDVGIRADWQVIQGADDFFDVTKAMHNALHGSRIHFIPVMLALWRRYNALNAALIDQDYDFVVVHDPQPAGLLWFLCERFLITHYLSGYLRLFNQLSQPATLGEPALPALLAS